MDETIQRAKRLRDSLLDVSTEFHLRRDGNLELNKMNASFCRDAADMLRTLGTEVERLRMAIGCFEYGRMSREDLVKIPLSWNGE